MPFAWTDPITEDTPLGDLDMLNLFLRASFNRAALGASNVFGTDSPAVFTTSTDVQSVGYIQEMQVLAASAATGWLNPSSPISFTTHPSGVPGYLFSTPVYNLWGDAIWAAIGLVLRSPGATAFTRRKSREISTATSTTDTTGNAISDGHKGWLLDPIDPNRGRLHKFDGAQGKWLPAQPEDGPPDTLDSRLAAPFTMPQGSHQPGDQRGPHLFNEIRDVYNNMKVQQGEIFSQVATAHATLFDAGWDSTSPGSDPPSGITDAISKAESILPVVANDISTWPFESSTGPFAFYAQVEGNYVQNSSPPSYDWTGFGVQWGPIAAVFGIFTARSPSAYHADIYFDVTAPPSGIGTSTFNAQGSGLAPGPNQLLRSLDVAAAPTTGIREIYTPQFGDPTVVPTADPSLSDPTPYTGTGVTDHRFDIPGTSVVIGSTYGVYAEARAAVMTWTFTP